MRNYMKYIAVFLIILITASNVYGKLEVPHILSDNMVLQRNAKLRIWGKGDDGTTVTVVFKKQQQSTVVENGQWTIWLNPEQAGGPYEMVISSGTETITLQNILIGEVWVSAGQSNMQFLLSKSVNAEKVMNAPANPEIRWFNQHGNGAIAPAFDNDGSWIDANPQSRKWTHAVSYYFALSLYEDLQIPIGIVKAAIGGTNAQQWTPLKVLEENPDLKHYADAVKALYPALSIKIAEHPEQLAVYKKKVKEAKAAGKTVPKRPRNPGITFTTGLYNGMIGPVENFTTKGVLWYQGEANSRADLAIEYRTLLPEMIKGWREGYQNPELYFLIVQLPRFRWNRDFDWAALREAQQLTADTLPYTGMAVIIDTGDEEDIHPPLKKPAGDRLALIARGKVYGEEVEHSGPVFSEATISESSVIISFNHGGEGLISQDNEDLREFTICGGDKKFLPATAVVEGNTVVVSHPEIQTPVAVRYAWQNYPLVNLFGKNGLPAAPFRTDKFPLPGEPIAANDEHGKN
jgi:sialate O-acetylesterase